MLNAHPELKSEMPRLKIGNDNVAFAMGGAYRANIELVTHETSQQAMAILFAVSDNHNGIIRLVIFYYYYNIKSMFY